MNNNKKREITSLVIVITLLCGCSGVVRRAVSLEQKTNDSGKYRFESRWMDDAAVLIRRGFVLKT